MSKHVGRKQRWNQESPSRYSSQLGKVVYQEKAWFALLDYRVLAAERDAGGHPVWEAHSLRLGPYRRPRNAMVALEREATVLQNRHGPNVLFGNQVWAES
jgi:hypothetical protein